MRPQDIIRHKRDAQALAPEEIDAFTQGLASGAWSDAQAAAMAMAIFLNGMSQTETLQLTLAMARSGRVLDWAGCALPGPILDKHSTGGVGDKVSLLLAPIVAACGGFVPMLSGRALGHTGGTLDKLESIPGYRSTPGPDELRGVLRSAGCAIVGANADLAPADRRLYAIRDISSSVESIPLITASILSKKLAAGLQGLVLDVKTGNGAFAASRAMALELAGSLLGAAQAAGLPTRAWITDMNQVLGASCGNAVEVLECTAVLQGQPCEPRLLEVTRLLSADLLLIGALASDQADALARVDQALRNGSALEHFARMVTALGGPADFVQRPQAYLAAAPAQQAVRAGRSGWIGAMDTRAIGELVLQLGGGRRQAGDSVDPRVGFTQVAPLGHPVHCGDLLALVHAASADAAAGAAQSYAGSVRIDEQAPQSRPSVAERISASASA